MKPVSVHPLANLLPDMTAEEYEGLKASIKERGQEVPILLLNGQILDGRHRYRACLDLGIEPVTKEIATADPLGLVFTLNLQRRHLNKGQVAMIAAKLTERGNKGGRPAKAETQQILMGFPSAQAAADASGVAPTYIREAIEVLEFNERCNTHLAEQVLSGERKLYDAHFYVKKEWERLKEQARAQAKADKLKDPIPVSPPFKPTAHPDEPRYAERLMANAVKSKDLDSSPIGEEFQEFIDRQDPEKLRRIHWASKVAEAMIVVSDAWRALELLGRDDRSTAWERCPRKRNSSTRSGA
jgi:hypothetical protein